MENNMELGLQSVSRTRSLVRVLLPTGTPGEETLVPTYLSWEGREHLQGPGLDLGPLALHPAKLVPLRHLVQRQHVELLVLRDVPYRPVVLPG